MPLVLPIGKRPTSNGRKPKFPQRRSGKALFQPGNLAMIEEFFRRRRRSARVRGPMNAKLRRAVRASAALTLSLAACLPAAEPVKAKTPEALWEISRNHL